MSINCHDDTHDTRGSDDDGASTLLTGEDTWQLILVIGMVIVIAMSIYWWDA